MTSFIADDALSERGFDGLVDDCDASEVSGTALFGALSSIPEVFGAGAEVLGLFGEFFDRTT